jgi:phosphoglycolate phosphatase
MASRKGALLFDLDGTLTDPREGITACLRHALESIAVPTPADQDLVSWIGPPLHLAFAEYLGAERSHLVPDAISAYRERFAAVGMFENEVYAGVKLGLEELERSGWALFVATSKPTVFAERILEHFDLRKFFAGVHGSELSGQRADKGELIGHLLRHEGVSASEAIMIGDRAHDALGAGQNGVRSFGVLWGFGSPAELASAGVERSFATFAELVEALTGS